MRVKTTFEKSGNCIVEIEVLQKEICDDFKNSKYFINWTCAWVSGAIRASVLNEIIKIVDDPMLLHDKEFRDQMNESMLSEAATDAILIHTKLKQMALGAQVQEKESEERDKSYFG